MEQFLERFLNQAKKMKILISSEVDPDFPDYDNSSLALGFIEKTNFNEIFKSVNKTKDLKSKDCSDYQLPARKFYGGPPLPFLKGENRVYPQNLHLERVLAGNIDLIRQFAKKSFSYKETYKVVMQ